MQSKDSFFRSNGSGNKRARGQNSKENQGGDRYIPKRTDNNVDMELKHAKLMGHFEESGTKYDNRLCEGLFGTSYDQIQSSAILSFSVTNPISGWRVAPKRYPYSLDLERILDAPNINNDYYANTLCWGDMLCIALGDKVYVKNLGDLEFIPVDTNPNSLINSVASHSHQLVRSGSDNTLQVIDLNTLRVAAHFPTPFSYKQLISDGTGGFFALTNNSYILNHYDLRSPVCTSMLNDPGNPLIGGAFKQHYNTFALSTSSSVRVFDIRNFTSPKLTINGHRPCSKALAFAPNCGYKLVTGGGCQDGTIRLWNTESGQNLGMIALETQVCGIHWVDDETIFTHHGFSPVQDSKYSNAVACWNVKNDRFLLDAFSNTTHSDRILFSSQNPQNKREFMVGGADEQISFWSLKSSKLPFNEKQPVKPPSALSMPEYR